MQLLAIPCSLARRFTHRPPILAQVAERSNLNKPCIYEWQEWSACSATCRTRGESYPVRYRKVNPDKIVQARGKFTDLAPCPANLTSKVDVAPCNTHYCPEPLTSFGFTSQCFRLNVSDEASGCYRIREVPMEDLLVSAAHSTPTHAADRRQHRRPDKYHRLHLLAAMTCCSSKATVSHDRIRPAILIFKKINKCNSTFLFRITCRRIFESWIFLFDALAR